MKYIALIHKDDDSDFGVTFPDFLGCVTAGKTLKEAKKMAKEALLDHIGVLKEMGNPIPEPTAIFDVDCSEDSFMFVVEVPEEEIKIEICFPEDVLKLVDIFAGKNKLSRSAFISKAVRNFSNKEQ